MPSWMLSESDGLLCMFRRMHTWAPCTWAFFFFLLCYKGVFFPGEWTEGVRTADVHCTDCKGHVIVVLGYINILTDGLSSSCVCVYTYVFVQCQVCRPLPLRSAYLRIVTWKPLQFPLLHSLPASDSAIPQCTVPFCPPSRVPSPPLPLPLFLSSRVAAPCGSLAVYQTHQWPPPPPPPPPPACLFPRSCTCMSLFALIWVENGSQLPAGLQCETGGLKWCSMGGEAGALDAAVLLPALHPPPLGGRGRVGEDEDEEGNPQSFTQTVNSGVSAEEHMLNHPVMLI